MRRGPRSPGQLFICIEQLDTIDGSVRCNVNVHVVADLDRRYLAQLFMELDSSLTSGIVRSDMLGYAHALMQDASPSLAGVAQDVDEVLACFRRKFDRSRAKEGHHCPSACRYAWCDWRLQ